MRCVHAADRRRTSAVVHHLCGSVRRRADHDDRRTRERPGHGFVAASVRGGAWPAMRVLHAGNAGDGTRHRDPPADADERRIRLELSGNLCRCTGYVGIVRAIRRVLQERRRGSLAASAYARRSLWAGRIAACRTGRRHELRRRPQPRSGATSPALGEADLGLGGKKPNIEIRQSFVIARPQREVWAFLADVGALPPACLELDSPVRTVTDGRARLPSSWGRSRLPSTGRHA